MQELLPKSVPGLVNELFSCPVCIGFWIALALAAASPIETLAISFIGSVLYELKEKFLPCKQCKNKVDANEWKRV